MAEDLSSGATAWVNGVLVTGIREDSGGTDVQKISIDLYSTATDSGNSDWKLVLTRMDDGSWEDSSVRYTDQGEESQTVVVDKVEMKSE